MGEKRGRCVGWPSQKRHHCRSTTGGNTVSGDGQTGQESGSPLTQADHHQREACPAGFVDADRERTCLRSATGRTNSTSASSCRSPLASTAEATASSLYHRSGLADHRDGHRSAKHPVDNDVIEESTHFANEVERIHRLVAVDLDVPAGNFKHQCWTGLHVR
jgi:hypothetical protein